MMKNKPFTALIMFSMAFSASAEVFTFTLKGNDGAVWDGVSSGVYANAGTSFTLEATLHAYLDGSASSGSLLNSGGSEFGINADGSGDASLAFDTINGKESVWISFSEAVTVKSITVSSFSTTGTKETGSYQVADGSVVEFSGSGTYGNIDTILAKDTYFKVAAVEDGDGNGWSLDSFEVEAVPEPVTVSMLTLGGLLIWIVRRVSCA
jgi:hypothetical protein